MSKDLRAGDRVAWNTVQGGTRGTVERKVTASDRVEGHVAKASTDVPRNRAMSAKTGKEVIQRPEGAA